MMHGGANYSTERVKCSTEVLNNSTDNVKCFTEVLNIPRKM